MIKFKTLVGSFVKMPQVSKVFLVNVGRIGWVVTSPMIEVTLTRVRKHHYAQKRPVHRRVDPRYTESKGISPTPGTGPRPDTFQRSKKERW